MKIREGRIRRIAAMMEVVAGAICIGISLYSLVEFSNCKPGATYCKPLTALQVLIFSFPGIALVAAGIGSLSTLRLEFWKIQAAMVISVVLYGLLLMGLFHYSPRLFNY